MNVEAACVSVLSKDERVVLRDDVYALQREERAD